MSKKYFVLAVLLFIGAILWINGVNTKKGISVPSGFVPDEGTAKKIAEAVWYPIYGAVIEKEKPFSVSFDTKRECWIVTGTLPENNLGGVAEIVIQKSDGRIQYVNHGK